MCLSAEAMSLAPIKKKATCYRCGYYGDISLHVKRCPALQSQCKYCNKTGHWLKMCLLKEKSDRQAPSKSGTKFFNRGSKPKMVPSSKISIASNKITAIVKNQDSPLVSLIIQTITCEALVDTGSQNNFISRACLKRLPNVQILKCSPIEITLANSINGCTISDCCNLDFSVVNNENASTCYKQINFFILPTALHDIILGTPFLKLHSAVLFPQNGTLPTFHVGVLGCMSYPAPSPFSTLDPNAVPIATKSRKYSEDDKKFIVAEIDRLLSEKIIEPSMSPWRAQVLVTNKDIKPRLVIDYSTTVNRFTSPDAYPIPNIEELVNSVAENTYFSQLDLKSAYHQLPLREQDRKFTAFEANGSLYQFTRLSFGLTNGVSCFQRVMDSIVRDHKLSQTYPYLDDITVAGRTIAEHDKNLSKFMKIAQELGITLNYEKCKFKQKEIKLLGYLVSYNTIKPDPDRFSSLENISLPQNSKQLERLRGTFAYYAKWLPNFSQRIKPLVSASFPLDEKSCTLIASLVNDLKAACKARIDPKLEFVVETDASNEAIGATLSQAGKPVAFFSRMLHGSELKHCSIEKEAYAIVESLRKWSHLLLCKKFTLITDQRSVSYMFSDKHDTKIKNEKIQRWRMELMPYKFEIIYRPGKDNVAADMLSRVKETEAVSNNLINCASVESNKRLALKLHIQYSHPGVTRMWEQIQKHKIPVTLEEVRSICKNCSICNEIKPQFVKPPENPLINSLRPFDRLSIDFKGPLATTFAGNNYLLIAVDEYSRYPFAFPCKNASAEEVINKLRFLFSIFGNPKYVHADRGTSMIAKPLKKYLFSIGVSSSHSSPYHPTGNAQCERYVGTVWQTVELEMAQNNYTKGKWDLCVDKALSSIRSLINTTTKKTPHELLFSYSRHEDCLHRMPDWLLSANNVYLRRFVRNKSDPLVDKVKLLEANPSYCTIEYPDGRKDNVSTHDISYVEDGMLEEGPEISEFSFSELPNEPDSEIENRSEISTHPSVVLPCRTDDLDSQNNSNGSESNDNVNIMKPDSPPLLRRSERIRRPPDRLNL